MPIHLKIKQKIQETPDTVSLVLGVPAEHQKQFQYQAGQFVTLHLDVLPGGGVLKRSYSFCSAPLVDADIKISVKKIPQGVASGFLVDQLQEGDNVLSSLPKGRFLLPNTSRSQCVFLAAGSGITPIVSLIKEALRQGKNAALLYGSRDEGNIIFKQELDQLTQRHKGRIKVEHFLSAQKGRLQQKDLETFFIKHAPQLTEAEYFFCGPLELMKNACEFLAQQGVPKAQLHRESFGKPNTKKAQAAQVASSAPKLWVGAEASEGPSVHKIKVTLDGKAHSLECHRGESLLEACLREGLEAPFSCTEGACMSCLAKLTKGSVRQKDYGILTEDNIKDLEFLSCSAFPEEGTGVEFSYDSTE